MKKSDIERILQEVETENSLFADKASLDNLVFPSSIIGREDRAKELIRFLAGYKKGLVVPFISVYGRSGSGKSTVVKFVCESIDGLSYCFVNLRKAKTVFGCANLILAELGQPSLKSAQGINVAIEVIERTIESVVKRDRLFVLVLDEFDVLFQDKRGKPSDFMYKLLVMEEKLRILGQQMTIIAISNNVVADYDVDDRVRSRTGSSEVFFNAYTKQDVLAILKNRAEKAFTTAIDPAVLEYCAETSSTEHGDARRAIDLLRLAAEIAGRKGENIMKNHVDMAAEQLQKDRLLLMLSSGSYHLRVAYGALAKLTFVTGEPWHSTSELYEEYKSLIREGTKPLTYRRVSELLTELENSGLAIAQTSSKGRHGYGTQYKLSIPPEIAGRTCFPEWWENVEKQKKVNDGLAKLRKDLDRMSRGSGRSRRGFSLI